MILTICLSKLHQKLKKMDTNMRPSLSPRDMLIVTLRYLATGDQYKSLEYAFRIFAQAISKFVPQVCDCLVEVLRNYVKLPTNSDEWMKIVQGFEEKWNFPHTLGAIDGKHVMIKAPPHSGTDYFNYRRFFSVVFLGVVDSNSNFIYADVGSKGRISDRGVFRNSVLYKKLERNECGIPSPAPLYQASRILVPYMFLGDKAFPLTHYCLRPFSGLTERGSVQRIFNMRHSIARRPVEMAYGIHSGRFRVLRKPIELSEENAKKVIMATIYLHNFKRRDENTRNQDANQFIYRQDDNPNMLRFNANRSRPNFNMMEIRMHMANYFVNN
ncbi:putative nuclease HARBI1 [Anopheles arabiensis]|uniref:putative nuclease HARBI1 n=1 Tax=Anopheles arabiensis TaxID=7173 RepID=UPI001AAD4651|nr:putative nuclease HARBI1 [Anopheles arabiensis]